MTEQPEFVTHSCPISEPFRRFAAMLDDLDRQKIAAFHDKGCVELMALIHQLRAYAWEKAGVILSTFGDEGDTSNPVEWYADMLAGKPGAFVPETKTVIIPDSEAP